MSVGARFTEARRDVLVRPTIDPDASDGESRVRRSTLRLTCRLEIRSYRTPCM